MIWLVGMPSRSWSAWLSKWSRPWLIELPEISLPADEPLQVLQVPCIATDCNYMSLPDYAICSLMMWVTLMHTIRDVGPSPPPCAAGFALLQASH